MNHSLEPKVAVVYLSYKSGQYIGEALKTLSAIRYPRDRWELVIVDNAVPGDNSAEVIRQTVVPRSGVDLPQVTLLENPTNLGYAGGMNTGMRYAADHGFEYVVLLNQDGEVDAEMLTGLVRVAESDSTIGAAQCFIRLHPETSLINSYGNELHYLGMGWSGGYRLPVKDFRPKHITDIAYASGAAVLYRVAALKDVGMFDEVMFLYHEDTDLSWRMRLRNWRVVVAPNADFYHKYEFNRSITKFYWILRNQLVVFLTLPKIATILLLAPMQLIFQTAMFIASFRSGFAWQVLRAWGFFYKPSTWKYIWNRRKHMQSVRKMDDKQVYAYFKSEIIFQDADSGVLKNIGNPMMRAYWKVIASIIRW